MIDTHAHLADTKFDDVGSVISRAFAGGVSTIIIPSTNLENLEQGLLIANQFEGVFVLAGVHPEELDTVTELGVTLKRLEAKINSERKIVGVGEIGMDFFYDKEKKTREKQIEAFTAQMELAHRLGKPVVIHARQAEAEILTVLRNLGSWPQGQFHCWGGSGDFLRTVLEMGFFVSFCGNITYKSAGRLREMVKMVPVDRLLLETDSPYLTPEPLRGGINEPINVKITAECIAKILRLELDNLIDLTTENSRCLFLGI